MSERLGELKSYAKNFSKKFFQQDILYLLLYYILILRQKHFGCSKFLWKDIWKKSFMFWLRNWSYLISSSSSSNFIQLLRNWIIFWLWWHLELCEACCIEKQLGQWKGCVTLYCLASFDSRGTINSSLLQN